MKGREVYFAVSILIIGLISTLSLCLGIEGWWHIVLRLIGCGAVAAFAYTRLCRRSIAGDWVLLASWSLLAIGYLLNLWWFTAANGATDSVPCFFNDDAAMTWRQLQDLATENEGSAGIRQYGYARVLYLWELGGSHSASGLMLLSFLAGLLTIVFSGASAMKALNINDRRLQARASAIGMGAMASICYFMSSSCLIIKDALMCCLMAAALYAFITLSQKPQWPKYLILIIVAVTAWYARPYLLVFAALAGACLCYALPRRLWPAVALFGIAALAMVIISRMNGQAAHLINYDDTNGFYIGNLSSERLQAYASVTGDYHEHSTVKRLLFLPFSLAVQFFTPLPWSWLRDTVYGPTQAWAHLAFPWYAFGGIFLYFILFCIRRAPAAISASAVFACLAYAATAFSTGGTVSRYTLPWIPAMVPAVVWVLMAKPWHKRAFRIFSIIFILCVALGLILIFNRLGEGVEDVKVWEGGILISLITVTRNDSQLFARAIESVYKQRLPENVELEHIIVDGNTEGNLRKNYNINASISTIYYREPKGVYDAVNYGISKAKGDIIGLLHGSDFFADDNILAYVSEAFNDDSIDFIYGDVGYVRYTSPNVIRRRYSAACFEPSQIKWCFAPPHPTLYLRRRVIEKSGLYSTAYRNAADFEYFVRLFLEGSNFKSLYLPRTLVLMDNRGASTTLYSRVITNSVEKRRALKDHGIRISWFKVFSRYSLYFKHLYRWL